MHPDKFIKNKIMKRFILILVFANLLGLVAQAQTDANIFGHVVCGNEHIPFAKVSLKGTMLGTITDASGHYRFINLPEGKFTIEVSAIGFKTIDREIEISKNHSEELNFEIFDDAVSVDQVVVSANRSESNRKDAPVIINTMNQELFDRTNSVCAADAMSFQPGLRLETNCQNCGFQQVRINGLDGPYSQILIDSRPIFSALSGVYGIEQMPVSMIERVEVMRGGGSALFGSNAIGGTINIITKEPQFNGFRLSSNVAAVEKNSLDISNDVNASVLTDDLKGGVTFFGSNRNREVYDANADSYSELGLIENNSFGFRSFYKTTAYSKIGVEYHNINEYRRGGNDFELQPHESDITEQVKHKINAGGLNYTLLSRNYKSKLHVFTSAQHTLRNSYYGAGEDLNAYGRTSDIASVSGLQFHYNFSNLLFVPANFTAGAEHQYNSLHDVMPGYNRDLKQTINVFAVFAQNEWKTKRTDLLLGARVDQHNLINKLIISPRANILIRLTTDLTSRITYSKGFRAPQAFDEDLHIAAVNGEVMLISLAENLRTESSHSVSSSLDYYVNFWGISANIMTEGFYTKLFDVFVNEEIGTDTEGNLLVERRNGSGAEVYGINSEARIAFSRKFEGQFGFTTQRSLYVLPEKWSDSEQLQAVRNMFRTPDNYGYFTLNYAPVSVLNTSLSGVYTGSMYVPHYAGYIAEDHLLMSNTFFELNFKIAYDIKIGNLMTLQLNGGIQNITNSYQSDFDKGANRDAGFIYGPSRPRTVFFGLKIGNGL